MKPGYLICLVAVIVIASSMNVRAAETTLTSTADFDAGTKSASGGNYQVETSTDNGGVAAGSIELGSGKGDAFTFADADGMTAKWSTVPASCTGGTHSIAAGVYDVITAGTAGGKVSAFTLSGDIDIREKVVKISSSSGVLDYVVTNEQVCTVAPATVDGILMERANSNALSALYCVSNGVPTISGVTFTVPDPGYYRVTRATDTWSFYYSSNGIDWTQGGSSCVQIAGSSLYVGLQVTGTAHYTFDDYVLAAGSVNSGGYRTTGSWASAGQTATIELFRSLNLTYSAATAATYVTAVSLISGAGEYRFIDNTDLITGTIHSYIVPDTEISGSWKVQVNLTGDGAGTVMIGSVVVFTSPFIPPPPPNRCGLEESLPGFSGLVIIIVALGLIGLAVAAFLNRKDQLTPTAAVGIIVGVLTTVTVAASFLSPFPC